MKKGFAIGRMSKGEMKIESLQDETILLLKKNNQDEQPVVEEQYEEEVVERLSDVVEEECTEIPEFIRNRRNLYRSAPRREEHSESFMKKLLNRIGGKR
ncbi:hypothetical protein_gp132 [Bacillus phage vB_BceM_WH1]|nr:hypothetical protein_gp132 [Bacillus phage vB_BceM_WH1]